VRELNVSTDPLCRFRESLPLEEGAEKRKEEVEVMVVLMQSHSVPMTTLTTKQMGWRQAS
jgi:hypothetical protein